MTARYLTDVMLKRFERTADDLRRAGMDVRYVINIFITPDDVEIVYADGQGVTRTFRHRFEKEKIRA